MDPKLVSPEGPVDPEQILMDLSEATAASISAIREELKRETL